MKEHASGREVAPAGHLRLFLPRRWVIICPLRCTSQQLYWLAVEVIKECIWYALLAAAAGMLQKDPNTLPSLPGAIAAKQSRCFSSA